MSLKIFVCVKCRIQSQLSNADTPTMRCLLASYYLQMQKYPESKQHYFAALRCESIVPCDFLVIVLFIIYLLID
jgi:hypothetical protein